MPLFTRKAEPSPAPPPPMQLPTIHEAPTTPAAAPKASRELEREIRREIWQHISPDLARSAGLSLPELIDWISGAARLSTPQIEAIARKMGLLDSPETGVDAIRKALVARMKRRAF